MNIILSNSYHNQLNIFLKLAKNLNTNGININFSQFNINEITTFKNNNLAKQIIFNYQINIINNINNFSYIKQLINEFYIFLNNKTINFNYLNLLIGNYQYNNNILNNNIVQFSTILYFITYLLNLNTTTLLIANNSYTFINTINNLLNFQNIDLNIVNILLKHIFTLHSNDTLFKNKDFQTDIKLNRIINLSNKGILYNVYQDNIQNIYYNISSYSNIKVLLLKNYIKDLNNLTKIPTILKYGNINMRKLIKLAYQKHINYLILDYNIFGDGIQNAQDDVKYIKSIIQSIQQY